MKMLIGAPVPALQRAHAAARRYRRATWWPVIPVTGGEEEGIESEGVAKSSVAFGSIALLDRFHLERCEAEEEAVAALMHRRLAVGKDVDHGWTAGHRCRLGPHWDRIAEGGARDIGLRSLLPRVRDGRARAPRSPLEGDRTRRTAGLR